MQAGLFEDFDVLLVLSDVPLTHPVSLRACRVHWGSLSHLFRSRLATVVSCLVIQARRLTCEASYSLLQLLPEMWLAANLKCFNLASRAQAMPLSGHEVEAHHSTPDDEASKLCTTFEWYRCRIHLNSLNSLIQLKGRSRATRSVKLRGSPNHLAGSSL